MNSVLITGATGFVGSHLARRLLEMGVTVHLIVRSQSSLSLLGDAGGRARTHPHDGSMQSLVRIMADARPDMVFHLASRFVSPHRTDDVDALIESNVHFGTQLLEAMAVNDIRYIVNTGTSWQHFEDADYRAVSLYAATKQAFEDILRYYADATAIRAISLQLFDTYGTGDPRPKLFHLLMKTAAAGGSLVMSPGEQQLDLVHVDDVVDAFLGAADRLLGGAGEAHDVFAVSAGSTMSLRALVETFGRVHGRPLQVEWGGRPYRFREVMKPWSAGRPLPGWAPRIGIEEGIRRVLDGR